MGLKDRLSASRLTGPVAILAVFAVSRAAYHHAGIRFDAGTLNWYWQFIDPLLLETDLLRSVFYLHSQPPLFNLFLGVVLQAAPHHTTAVFAAIYHLIGASLALTLYFLMIRLGAKRAWAAALALVFVISPAAILHESWLFYAYPLTAALAASALALHRLLDGHRWSDAVVFFALLASIALTWSVFHFAWCVLCASFVSALASPHQRRRVAALAAVTLVVVGGVYVKNWIVFGQPTASSWLGMSLARFTLQRAAPPLLLPMIEEGTLSPLAIYVPFYPVDSYPPVYIDRVPPPVPVLQQRLKSTGAPNLNHIAYLEVSRQFLQDSRAMIARWPGIYVGSVLRALAIYAQPSTNLPFLGRNRAHIERWDYEYNRWVLGAFALEPPESRCTDYTDADCLGRSAAYLWATVIVVATVAGLRRGVIDLRRPGASKAGAGTLLFLAGNVLYVTIVANLTELAENNRFRFAVDPLVLALAVALVAGAVKGRSALRPPD